MVTQCAKKMPVGAGRTLATALSHVSVGIRRALAVRYFLKMRHPDPTVYSTYARHLLRSRGQACSQWEPGVVAGYLTGVSGEESGGAYTLVDFSADHGSGSPRRIHQDADEAFYVLDHEMRLVCGSKEWQASAGSLGHSCHEASSARRALHQRIPVCALQITSRPGSKTSSAMDRRPDTAGLPTRQMLDVARMAEVSQRFGTITVYPPPRDSVPSLKGAGKRVLSSVAGAARRSPRRHGRTPPQAGLSETS
jgi:hypothetical protein